MNAERLLSVWSRLNLWPWLSVGVGGIIVLVTYAVTTTSGQRTSEALAPRPPAELTFKEQVAAQVKQTKEIAQSIANSVENSFKSGNEAIEKSLPPVPSTRPQSRPKGLVVLNEGSMGKTESGFKDLAGKIANDVYIPTGSVFRAQLIMPIKTSVQERFVMAQTTHEFQDPANSARRIPVGSRLIGRASLNYAIRGVDVRFHTLVSPKGKEYSISVLALSKQLFGELNGIFFSNDLETYSTIMAFGFLGGFADAAKERENTLTGQVTKETVSNKALSGVGSASFRIADEIMNDIRSKSIEYVVVPSGESIFAVFTEKFSLPGGKRIE